VAKWVGRQHAEVEAGLLDPSFRRPPRPQPRTSGKRRSVPCAAASQCRRDSGGARDAWDQVTGRRLCNRGRTDAAGYVHRSVGREFVHVGSTTPATSPVSRCRTAVGLPAPGDRLLRPPRGKGRVSTNRLRRRSIALRSKHAWKAPRGPASAHPFLSAQTNGK
jgi:hypothetical protein